MSNSPKRSIPVDVWQMITQVYGPYAFGVISLLLIWFSIVKPELSNRTIDFQSHNEILKTQQGIVGSLESTAKTLQVTATIMERAVTKLDAIEDRR